jgi:hypothetical protein
MPCEKLFGLDAKSKELWEKLYDKSKYTILGYDSGITTSFFKPPNKSSPFQRKVNLHEMTAYNFLEAYSHQVDDSNPHYGSNTLSSASYDLCDATW